MSARFHHPHHHPNASAAVDEAVAVMAMPALFFCDRQRARLTEAGCARMWASARDRPPWPDEARARCVGCAIGARHAGVDVEELHRAARAAELAGWCARCNAGGRRMIGGAVCISCYNRQREAERGRDARGKVPGFARRYQPAEITVVLPGGIVAVRTFALVASRAEAIMRAARDAQGAAIAIGFSRLAPLPPGAELDPPPAFAPAPPPPPG